MLIQTVTRTPSREYQLVIGCRDAEFGAKLFDGQDPRPATFQPIDPQSARQVIADYWIGLRKHRKALYRDLDIVAWHGECLLRQYLFRLYHMLAVGTDCGSIQSMNIHSMTPAVRNVQAAFGGKVLAELGRPARTRAEFVAAATAIADEVARVGRLLADRTGFDYPSAESAARTIWSSND